MTRTNIILAPSGAGKSFAVSRYPNFFADGDDAVAAGPGWPSTPYWWDDPHREKFDTPIAKAVLDAAAGDPRVVLFNGVLPLSSVGAVWLPTAGAHQRNLQMRRDRGVTSQPNTWMQVVGNREYVLSLAAKGVPLILADELTPELATAALHSARGSLFAATPTRLPMRP